MGDAGCGMQVWEYGMREGGCSLGMEQDDGEGYEEGS